MAGIALARPLTPRAAGPGRFQFAVASPADDADVRTLLREHPLGGDVRVTLEREPDSALAATIEGDVHQTIVARDGPGGSLVAMAARAEREMFVNGGPGRVGYLGQFRVVPRFRRHRALLDEGFTFARRLHDAGRARVYLMSLIEGAPGAERLLAEGPFRDRPTVRRLERFVTLAIPVRGRRASRSTGVSIERGTEDRLPEIAACLSRNGTRHQFAPRWTTGDLKSPDRSRGLEAHDFFVAYRDGRCAGCLARWDQRAFKQVVVRGYAPRLARWRAAINLAAPWLAMPRLPPAGTALDVAHLSHLSVDDDEPDVALALLKAALTDEETRAFSHLTIGLAERHPLYRSICAAVPHRRYAANLWIAYWSDGEEAARSLDGRVPYPEGALL